MWVKTPGDWTTGDRFFYFWDDVTPSGQWSRGRNNPGEPEGKHIIYTNNLLTRGQSFIHPTLAREDVFSTERMRGCAISEYVVSHTLGTYILQHSSLPFSSSSPPILFLFSSPLLWCESKRWLYTLHWYESSSTHSIDVSQDTWWPLRHRLHFHDDVTPSGQWSRGRRVWCKSRHLVTGHLVIATLGLGLI